MTCRSHAVPICGPPKSSARLARRARASLQTSAAILGRDNGYDPADQLTRAVKKTTGATPTILKRYAYGSDAAGNRLYEQIDDAVTGWTHDNLNRLVTQYGGGALRFGGTVNEPATVTIAGQPATVSPSGAFERSVPVTTGANTVAIAATDASGNTATATYQVSIGPSEKTFAYDATGNLTSDGVRTFEWDAKQQLRTASAAGSALSAQYAAQGYLTQAHRVTGPSQTTWEFVWCGDRVCEERQTGASPRMRYAFGVMRDGVAYFVTRDHIGSVRETVTNSGVLATRLNYDPFGRSDLTHRHVGRSVHRSSWRRATRSLFCSVSRLFA